MYMFVPLLGIRDGHVRQLTTLKSLGTRCGLWTGGATKLRPSLLAAQDEKEVRRFLGLAVYYRRFITGSAEFPSPLTDLTYLTWKDQRIGQGAGGRFDRDSRLELEE
ncbi:uncharacterized protein AB9W97_001488 isoform 3-T3 [Spinachia spinachia]